MQEKPLEMSERKKKMKSAQCPICEKWFSKKSNANHHQKTVHANTLIQCKLCIKRFKTRYNLKRHIKVIHSKSYEDKEILDEIKRMDFKHKCSVCDKKFPTRMQLLQHIQGKHTAKTFQCPQCIRRFVWRSSLWNHLKFTHKNCVLKYEKKCLNGMKELNSAVQKKKSFEEISDKEDICKYVQYLLTHSNRYRDENVFNKLF